MNERGELTRGVLSLALSQLERGLRGSSYKNSARELSFLLKFDSNKGFSDSARVIS